MRQRTHPRYGHRSFVAALVVSVTWFATAPAVWCQLVPCFESASTVPWTGVDVGTETPGTSRPIVGGGDSDYELCGASAGFGGGIDSCRFLTEAGDGDVTLLAMLESIGPTGSAGLMVRQDERDSASAHVRILVVRGPRDSYELRSAARLEPGLAASEGAATPVSVSLPLLLKIERRGDTIATYYDSAVGFQEHLAVAIGGSDFEGERLKYGMTQCSNDAGSSSTARFRRASLTELGGSDPGIDCFPTDIAVPAEGETQLTLRGTLLDRVTGATVAGQTARILEQSATALTLHVPPFDPGRRLAPLSGDIILDTGRRKVVLPNAITFAGRPFIRGDANNDNLVDLSDGIFILARLFLGGAPPACPEAGDANDDDVGDLSDGVFIFQFLFLGGNRIPPPFPEPGQPPKPSYPCGIAPGPVWEDLAFEDGSPIRAADTLREGDIVVFRLRGLEADPFRLRVLFGDTPTQVLPRSTPEALRLRIGAVPTSGRKCPLLFESTRVEPDAARELTDEMTYLNERGIALAADPTGEHTDHCPQFQASSNLVLAASSVPIGPVGGPGGGAQGMLLRFDRARWTSLESHRIELRVFPPLLSRGSRGPRLLCFDYVSPPPVDFRGAPGGDDDFARWLSQLARRIRVELAGGDPRAGGGDNPCGEGQPCDDVGVDAQPENSGVALFPCGAANDLAPYPNHPGPDPPGPGPGSTLKAPEPSLWSGTSIVPQSPCKFSAGLTVRQRAWCRLIEVTQPQVNSGLPKWEHWAPRSAMTNPVGLNETKQPPERPVGEKAILFNLPAFIHFRFGAHYNIPCVPTQNFLGCTNGNSHWMPSFPQEAMVAKTFWRTSEYLPKSADPNDYYSYQPPGKERQYLVGMHLNTKDPPGEVGATGSWLWATFFVPPPLGDTQDKAGRPLTDRYNAACSTGHRNDMPLELQGVWRNFVLCTDTEGGEDHRCGNPWGPKDECLESTCNDCHTVRGEATYPESNFGMSTHQFQWMFSIKPSGSTQQDCYDTIRALLDADKPTPYEAFMNPQCQ